MKIRIITIAAISFSLTCASVAENYSDLAAQGYRWIAVNGPYACPTKQDLERITTDPSDETELRMVEDLEAYYLIPGTISRLVQEDPVSGMSQVLLAGITTPLWTYTSFLSKDPIEDTYGVIETPENSGLIPEEATSSTIQAPDRSQAMPSFSTSQQR
jgi:hypothetical protein